MDNDTWKRSTNRHLRLSADGTWYAIKEELTPVNPSKILQEFVQDMGFLTPLLGKGTHVYFKAGNRIIVKLIDEIPFRAEMVVDPSSVKKGEERTKVSEEKTVRYMPAFFSNATGIVQDPPFIYTPPSSMRLILTVTAKESIASIPYLFAQHRETGKVYHPIVPNVYDNGKMCLGGVAQVSYMPSVGLQPYIDSLFAEWSNSNWNGDLAGSGGSRPADWLKFDEKTRKNIIPNEKDDPWTNYAGIISPPPMYAETLEAIHEAGGKEGW